MPRFTSFRSHIALEIARRIASACPVIPPPKTFTVMSKFFSLSVSVRGCFTLYCNVPVGKRSEEHTSELQSRPHLVCRLLLEKKKLLTYTSARMMKAELPCVQHLAAKIFGDSLPIDFVTQDSMTKMMQMHPHLLCAAGVQFAF